MYINGQNPFLFRPIPDNDPSVRTNTDATQGTNFSFTTPPVKNDSIPNVQNNGVLDNIQTLNAQKAGVQDTQPQKTTQGNSEQPTTQKSTASNDIHVAKGWKCEYAENEEGYYLISPNGANKIAYSSDGIEQRGTLNGYEFETITNPDGTYTRKYEDSFILNYDKYGHEIGGVTEEGKKFTSSTEGNTTTRHYAGGETEIVEYNYNDEVERKTTIKKYNREPKITEYQRNSEGKIAKKTTTWGTTEPETVECKYSPNGNKTQTTKKGNSTINREYNASGYLIKETSQRGKNPPTITTYKYDENNNVSQEITKQGKDTPTITTYKYDENGNRISETTTEGKKVISKTQYEYKETDNGIITISTAKTDDKTVITEYDEDDNRIKETTHQKGKNPITIDCTYEYDSEGNLIRATNSAGGIGYEHHIEANGKFDSPISQNGTGDCWLLSGLESIMMRPGGKEYLESLVKFDEKTGDAEVTLPGVGKTYKITYEEMEEAGFLANGDGDIRVFELAMHKLMKTNPEYKAKLYEANGITIESNWEGVIFDAVMPKPNQTQYQCEPPFNTNYFNRKDFSTTVGFKEDVAGLGIGPNGQKINIIAPHAYSVHHSDKEYVYLQNPWDEFDPNNPDSNLIKIKISDFKKNVNDITSRRLNFPTVK